MIIGVIADSAEHDVVREFFELFKTPWEFYRADRNYDVLICSGDQKLEVTAKLVILYAGRKTQFDMDFKIQTGSEEIQPCSLSYNGRQLPLYGSTITFPGQGITVLKQEDSKECAAFQIERGGQPLVRIGYDLFDEVRKLLTEGQPISNASLPAMELHIAFLRNLIIERGIPLVEIPPVPDGYQFIACLTHDIDHPSIRAHKFDHTMFGFLFRAILGSFFNVIRGRMSVGQLTKNWTAALKLPFVYLGLAKDYWREFDTLYLEMEKGLRSTYFVIPFKKRPGSKSEGQAPAARGAGYGAKDISDAIRNLRNAGCEVGLHGIDAWVDSAKGCEEAELIRNLTGSANVGVRMHWLYFDEKSPSVLESAGMAYDSTSGYNGAVGYRAGTTQVYKPLNTRQLLELPLHIMDTALFYPSHLGLSPQQAKLKIEEIVENAASFGGTLTVNWHDRSLAPERLWGDCYVSCLQDLKGRGAWFATAGQAVSWFQKRRSATFEMDSTQHGRNECQVRA